jgi:hypothetical protein
MAEGVIQSSRERVHRQIDMIVPAHAPIFTVSHTVLL